MTTIGKMKTGAMIAVMSIGMTAAAPARAFDGEDLLGVIVGLAAIAAINGSLKDDDRGKAHRSYRQHRSRILPEACLRRVETRRGVRDVLGARCLERSGIRTARLPDRCERRIERRHGVRRVFGVRCLQKAGYRIGWDRARRY